MDAAGDIKQKFNYLGPKENLTLLGLGGPGRPVASNF